MMGNNGSFSSVTFFSAVYCSVCIQEVTEVQNSISYHNWFKSLYHNIKGIQEKQIQLLF